MQSHIELNKKPHNDGNTPSVDVSRPPKQVKISAHLCFTFNPHIAAFNKDLAVHLHINDINVNEHMMEDSSIPDSRFMHEVNLPRLCPTMGIILTLVLFTLYIR